MQILHELLSGSLHIYGPVTKQQAFDVPVPSKATQYQDKWYIGTDDPLDEYKHLEIILRNDAQGSTE